MNPKFKDLAKQAGLMQTKWADADTEKVRIWQESLNNPGSLEKFAKLLIQECCNVLVKEGDAWLAFAKNPPQGQENNVNSALFAAFRLKEDAVFAIKEQFGIEHDQSN